MNHHTNKKQDRNRADPYNISRYSYLIASLHYGYVHDQLHPPLAKFKFATRIQFHLVAANYYSKQLWLHAKTFLIALKNYFSCPGNCPSWLGEFHRVDTDR